MAVSVSFSENGLLTALEYGYTPTSRTGGIIPSPLFLTLRLSSTELSTGNGYTAGGKTLQNVWLNYNAGELKMYADDVSWFASGAGITASSAALYFYKSIDSSPARTALSTAVLYNNSTLLATIDFDGSKTTVAGTTLTVAWPSGLLFKWKML